ncbi:hypothetical protein G9A89_016443 [Geosiphon pyriformis]|nr:hypothetical protein G9A89_016443 [Geosiphon pyriformis]
MDVQKNYYQTKELILHDNQLPNKPVEFKIGDKVLLHCTKVEKQWSKKFDPKWDGPFHIEEILGNGAYKLRLDNKILTKAVHGDQLKPYCDITLPSTNNIPQLGDKPEILLNKAMDIITSNQLEKITNAQFEELQTQITQVILENKIQEILQKGELHELDFDGAQY